MAAAALLEPFSAGAQLVADGATNMLSNVITTNNDFTGLSQLTENSSPHRTALRQAGRAYVQAERGRVNDSEPQMPS